MGTAGNIKKVPRRLGASIGPNGHVTAPWLLLGILLLPLLTACQPGEPRPTLPAVTEPPSNVAESFRKYSPVVDGIRNALEEEFPGIAWQATEPADVNVRSDGGCTLFLPTYQSDGDITGASNKFQKVMDAINPVLKAKGFSTVSILDEGSEGWWSVTSGNAQGATARIFGRTWVELTLQVPVESESCSAVELPGPATTTLSP
ncbi:MAG TPA: hypothetical protein VD841_06505 [Arthrobacter sp.]|nr:hypothetical protein [Arthrobacter sp.]